MQGHSLCNKLQKYKLMPKQTVVFIRHEALEECSPIAKIHVQVHAHSSFTRKKKHTHTWGWVVIPPIHSGSFLKFGALRPNANWLSPTSGQQSHEAEVLPKGSQGQGKSGCPKGGVLGQPGHRLKSASTKVQFG